MCVYILEIRLVYIVVNEDIRGKCFGKILMKKALELVNGDLTLQNRINRLIQNRVPIGFEVCPSNVLHVKPYRASTDIRLKAVGISLIKRCKRPFSIKIGQTNYCLIN